AAALLGVATVILEPNAKPGFTNRVLRPFVRRAACAYEETRREFGSKGIVTGNPVRGGFARLPRKPHAPPLALLAFGGSQGSRVLNRALVAALPHLPGPDRLRIVHQTGVAMRDAGAARMIEEKDLGGESLARAVMETVGTPGRLEAMEEAARGLGRPDAAARVADLLEGRG